MARKKVAAEPAFANWDEVDKALQEIHEADNSIAEITAMQNREIDDIKEKCNKLAEPHKNKVKELEANLREYTSAHRVEMDGKSKKLNFGIVGFRQSSKISIPTSKIADAIIMLKNMGLTACLKIDEKLDKEQLRKQPSEILAQVGAAITTKDEFYYELEHAEIIETEI